jgi:hypothetical protein
MSLTTASVVLVRGADVGVDAVRRLLWLPRQPDARRSSASLLARAAHPGVIGLSGTMGRVLVHGLTAVAMRRTWLDLSRDGASVLALRLAETAGLTWWCLYEGGKIVRQVDERTKRDFGERLACERRRESIEPYAARLHAVYAALAGATLDENLGGDLEVDCWHVDADAPVPRAVQTARESA